jgi:hypothetical protein
MIRVDGVEIPERSIVAEMRHHPAASREAARRGFDGTEEAGGRPPPCRGDQGAGGGRSELPPPVRGQSRPVPPAPRAGRGAPGPGRDALRFPPLRLPRHEPGRDPPLEAVAPRVAAWLRGASRRRSVPQQVGILAGCARIEGFAPDDAACDGPLVQ